MARSPDICDHVGALDSLAGSSGLIAAVSGGPDSTALMVLLADWKRRQSARGNPVPSMLIAHVDHGLRPASGEEADLVAKNARKVGLAFQGVTIDAPKPKSNIQHWARVHRYRCLCKLAREQGWGTIVTAHHREDHAETLLLRLERGAGIFGLGGIAPEVTMDGIRVVRPLLGFGKADLAAIVAHRGLMVVNDPSNRDPAFDRVRIRQVMSGLEGLALKNRGLDAKRLAAIADAIRESADCLDDMVTGFFAAGFHPDPYGTISGPGSLIARRPEIVGLRMLGRLLRAAGGTDYAPGQDAMRNIFVALQGGTPAPFKKTLNGVVVTASNGQVSFMREWGRAGPPECIAAPGTALIWDRRFRITVPQGEGAAWRIAGLGGSGRKLRLDSAQPECLATLPGLFCGRQLIAAPAGIVTADDGGSVQALKAECLVGGILNSPRAILLADKFRVTGADVVGSEA